MSSQSQEEEEIFEAPPDFRPPGPDTIYDMLFKYCGQEPVADLLREFRPVDKEIRIGAENKSALIHRNLRLAVDRGVIPIHRLYSLLRAAEENGAQRIFFYKPIKSLEKHYTSGEAVAARLFGKGAAKERQFPLALVGPSDQVVCADFRWDANEWVAKFYWKDTHYQTIGEDAEDGIDPFDGQPIYKRRYKRVVERAVLLMRRNRLGIFEVRVPLCTSRKTVETMEQRVWTEMAGAADARDFKEWSMVTACTRMIMEEDKHSGVYELADTLLRDSQGATHAISLPVIDGASFSEDDDKEEDPEKDKQTTLFGATERREAVEAILRISKNKSERLVVSFKPTPQNGVLQEPLRVVVAAYDFHEIAIRQKVSPEAVDHVIYRLREFS